MQVTCSNVRLAIRGSLLVYVVFGWIVIRRREFLSDWNLEQSGFLFLKERFLCYPY